MRKTLFSALVLLVFVAPVSAQGWDAPSFFSPRSYDALGLYVFAPDNGDAGVQGIWRQSGNLNLGVRAGIANDLVLVGAEFYGPLQMVSAPLRLAWNLGVGASFMDQVTHLRVPLGLSIGGTIGSSGALRLTPYVHPRVALALTSFDVAGDERTDTDVDVDVDLGADLNLSPNLLVQFGATLGANDAFGVGVAWNMQRRVVVR